MRALSTSIACVAILCMVQSCLGQDGLSDQHSPSPSPSHLESIWRLLQQFDQQMDRLNRIMPIAEDDAELGTLLSMREAIGERVDFPSGAAGATNRRRKRREGSLRSVYDRERGTLRALMLSIMDLVSRQGTTGPAKKSTPISFTRL